MKATPWTPLIVMSMTIAAVAPVFAVPAGSSLPGGEIRDIRGPLPPARLFPWLLTVGCAVAVTGSASLCIMRRRRRGESMPQSVEPVLPPEAALALLEERFRERREEIDLIYGDLSGLVRVTLEERTGFPATRMTSREIMDGLSVREGADPVEIQRLQSLLLRCDLVKFAGAAPTPAEIGEDLAAARTIILSFP